ncbi:hypothetical protein LTR27_000099 [Elasticomyces elasticus]|nr:hypothetical protein LTR27_000099 [Elasticomyces elasticus]
MNPRGDRGGRGGGQRGGRPGPPPRTNSPARAGSRAGGAFPGLGGPSGGATQPSAAGLRQLSGSRTPAPGSRNSSVIRAPLQTGQRSTSRSETPVGPRAPGSLFALPHRGRPDSPQRRPPQANASDVRGRPPTRGPRRVPLGQEPWRPMRDPARRHEMPTHPSDVHLVEEDLRASPPPGWERQWRMNDRQHAWIERDPQPSSGSRRETERLEQEIAARDAALMESTRPAVREEDRRDAESWGGYLGGESSSAAQQRQEDEEQPSIYELVPTDTESAHEYLSRMTQLYPQARRALRENIENVAVQTRAMEVWVAIDNSMPPGREELEALWDQYRERGTVRQPRR